MAAKLPEGPWTREEDHARIYIVAPQRSRPSVAIASVPILSDGAEAVAAAILALPDLLHALEEARLELDPCSLDAGRVRGLIDAALRKAGVE